MHVIIVTQLSCHDHVKEFLNVCNGKNGSSEFQLRRGSGRPGANTESPRQKFPDWEQSQLNCMPSQLAESTPDAEGTSIGTPSYCAVLAGP